MTAIYRLRRRSAAQSTTVHRESPARCWMKCCLCLDAWHQRMHPSISTPSSDLPCRRSEATTWPHQALSRSAGIEPAGSHIRHFFLRDVSSGAYIDGSCSSRYPPDVFLGCAHFRGSSSRLRSTPAAQSSPGPRGCE